MQGSDFTAPLPAARRFAAWLLCVGCGLAAATASTATPPVPVDTVLVGAEAALQERLFDGVVEAVNQATFSAQTAGRVAQLPYDVDAMVPAGAVLVRLRAEERAAALVQAQATVREAAARAAEAQANFSRIDDMYRRRVVARSSFDEASAARESALAQLAAARAGQVAAREGVAYTEVRAPYAATVTQKHAQVGESVAPGTALISIAALGAVRVLVDLPQDVAQQLKTRRAATVYLGARRLESQAITLFPAADPATSRFRARIDLPDAAGPVAPGTLVKVGVVTGSERRLLVPWTAVVERSEMRAVYVVAGDGGVSLRQVRLGRRSGERVEVLAGLLEGERVAVDPAAAARAGRKPAASAHPSTGDR